MAPKGRPVVVTLRDAPLTILRYKPDAYRAVRTAMAVAVRARRHTLTAVSPYVAKAWKRQMLDRRAVSIIPNVVPIPDLTTRVAGVRERPTILEIASDGRLKNVSSLIRAMPSILSTNPGTRLVLVGPGLVPESGPGRLAEHLGIADSVEFLGPVIRDELEPLFSEATVFVHASREESFGMSLGEAMAHGLPVIGGSQTGAVPWLLEHGRAGILVDTSQPARIAEAVSSLLQDESLRKSLGEAARERVVSRFSASDVVSGYSAVFEKAAASRG
jgi:glycosyltransferase involved in cell wall biosynthesis